MTHRYPSKDSLETRLATYSAAAGAALLAFAPTTADAQVVYTDLDPDVSLATGNDLLIDFDGDGRDDVQFVLDNPFSGFYRALVFADEDNGGGIAGFGPVTTNYNYFYASVLEQSTDISGDNVVTRNTNTGDDGNRDDFLLTSLFGGGVYGNWTGEMDKYVGVRFQTTQGTTHYAWVRLDVASATEITIKDYAFEATPDTPIAAGAMGTAVEPGALAEGYEFSPIGPNPIRTSAQFSVQVAAPEHVRVAVYDLLGRDVAEVFDGELAAGVARRMELQVGDLPAGTYVVRVTGDSFDTVRRVTIAR